MHRRLRLFLFAGVQSDQSFAFSFDVFVDYLSMESRMHAVVNGRFVKNYEVDYIGTCS